MPFPYGPMTIQIDANTEHIHSVSGRTYSYAAGPTTVTITGIDLGYFEIEAGFVPATALWHALASLDASDSLNCYHRLRLGETLRLPRGVLISNSSYLEYVQDGGLHHRTFPIRPAPNTVPQMSFYRSHDAYLVDNLVLVPREDLEIIKERIDAEIRSRNYWANERAQFTPRSLTPEQQQTLWPYDLNPAPRPHALPVPRPRHALPAFPEDGTVEDPPEGTTYPQEALTSSTRAPYIPSVATPQPNEADQVLVSNRTFGIELEMNIPTRGAHAGINAAGLADLLTRRGIPCRAPGYTHAQTSTWKVVSDATVPSGYELVSRVLKGEEGLDEVRKVCEVLVEAKYGISKNCGFHCHVGYDEMTEVEKVEVAKRYGKFEADYFDWFMPASRRGNANSNIRSCVLFARSPLTDTLDGIGRLTGLADWQWRYHKVNLFTTGQGRTHPTIEFRHHSGTVEADKVVNWIKLCVAFVEATIKRKRYVPNPMPVQIGQRLDVLSKIKRYYRGETTKAYLVAKLLLEAQGAGYTRHELASLVGSPGTGERQLPTQISVILQSFKEKGFGLVMTKGLRQGASQQLREHRYKLVPPMVGEVQEVSIPEPLPEDSWDYNIPSDVVAFYTARRDKFRRAAGLSVPNEVSGS